VGGGGGHSSGPRSAPGRPAQPRRPPRRAAHTPTPDPAAPVLPTPPRASRPPKAYRRLALVKHPDKAKTPNAAAEFAELQKAYALLCDPDARGALDDYIRWAGAAGGQAVRRGTRWGRQAGRAGVGPAAWRGPEPEPPPSPAR
jgi:hypothetical protein